MSDGIRFEMLFTDYNEVCMGSVGMKKIADTFCTGLYEHLGVNLTQVIDSGDNIMLKSVGTVTDAVDWHELFFELTKFKFMHNIRIDVVTNYGWNRAGFNSYMNGKSR